MRSVLLGLLLIGAVLFLSASRAEAIPAFARRYGTSCQTCHVIYPKLTPFGEAFRRNGFKFPGKDEDFVKQEQVPLGQEAYRQVFPDAVWPGTLPEQSAARPRIQRIRHRPSQQVIRRGPGGQRRACQPSEPRRGGPPVGGRQLQRAHRLLRRGDVRRRRPSRSSTPSCTSTIWCTRATSSTCTWGVGPPP